MTPSSSSYNLNSINEYSRALESVRTISRAVALVEQGKVVDNFSVYEEAFENLNRSLAAAKAKGNMTPQLQNASAKLEGLLGQLSKRVESVSAKAKQASSASFGTRIIDWVSSAKAPKEQIVGAAKTVGNAGQWAWSHKKTVAGGAVLGAAIYNDAFGVLRTAVSTCSTFWEFAKGFPAFVSQFTSQTEKFAEEAKKGASNVKQVVEDVTLPVGVAQDLFRQNIDKCRNAESAAECFGFVTDNFGAMQKCLPIANDPFDLKRWFWCVDNKLSGGSTSSLEQFQDERTSQVANTALSIFAQVALAKALGIKTPGGSLFDNYIGPWIVPNIILSSVYPQYIEDIKTYCASHPVLCTAAGTTAFLKGSVAGTGILAGGTSLSYIDQQFLDGRLNNATQYVLSHPEEVSKSMLEGGQQVKDVLLENPEWSFRSAVGLPSLWSAIWQARAALAEIDEGLEALAAGHRASAMRQNLRIEQDALVVLEERKAVVDLLRPDTFDDVNGLAAWRLEAQAEVDAQKCVIEHLQAAIPAARAAIPRYIPSWKTLTMLGVFGFWLPKVPRVYRAISSAAGESNTTLSGISAYAMDHASLVVPQVVIDNQATVISSVAMLILPQVAVFFIRLVG